LPAPTPPVAPDRPKDSRRQPTDFAAGAYVPSPAMAPPPERDLLPKVQTSKPAPDKPARDPIRQQFGEAKRAVTSRGDPTEQALRRKRKQKEDGERSFISAAKVMVKRLARAARRTWKFFWERNTPVAPSQDMRLDPRYAAWYAADPNAGSISFNDCNQINPRRPGDFPPGDFPSLNL
jgi:hypothetical protein